MKKLLKGIFILLFIAILLIAASSLTAFADSFELDPSSTASASIDGIISEGCWSSAYSKLVPTYSEGAFASVSMMFGSGKLFICADISETELIFDSRQCFDGIVVIFSGCISGTIRITYDGAVLSDSTSAAVSTASKVSVANTQYTLEISADIGFLLNYGDEFSVSVSVNDATLTDGAIALVGTFGAASFPFRYGSSVSEAQFSADESTTSSNEPVAEVQSSSPPASKTTSKASAGKTKDSGKSLSNKAPTSKNTVSIAASAATVSDEEVSPISASQQVGNDDEYIYNPYDDVEQSGEAIPKWFYPAIIICGALLCIIGIALLFSKNNPKVSKVRSSVLDHDSPWSENGYRTENGLHSDFQSESNEIKTMSPDSGLDSKNNNINDVSYNDSFDPYAEWSPKIKPSEFGNNNKNT